jgi:hypothetical protein
VKADFPPKPKRTASPYAKGRSGNDVPSRMRVGRHPVRGLAAVLGAAGFAALALLALIGRGNGPTALTGLDADDRTFFSATRALADQGDKTMLRVDEAMKDKDLTLALHLGRDAERAYRKGLADRRAAIAEKVEQQLQAAIDAKTATSHRARIGDVLKHAEQLNARAQATAAGEEHKLAGGAKMSSAEQVALLRKSQRLLQQRVPSATVANAAKRIAALAGKAGTAAKLATMDNPDKVLDLNPSVAFPPTHQAGNQWDAEPVPKVLDCGPLSNNCNTKQGGEYYSHHKGEKVGAGKKGALRAAAQARFAMLAKRGATRKHAAGVLGEPLLKPTTSEQDSRQLRWLEGKAPGLSPTENFLKDLASLRARGQRQQLLHEQAPEAAGADSDDNRGTGASVPGQTILQAGDKLDEMQQRLNERREALFAEYVGPLALLQGTNAAPLAVTVWLLGVGGRGRGSGVGGLLAVSLCLVRVEG